MTALKDIEDMRKGHEALMTKYEGSAARGDSIRYHMHKGMASSFAISARIVRRARIRLAWQTALFFAVAVGVAWFL